MTEESLPPQHLNQPLLLNILRGLSLRPPPMADTAIKADTVDNQPLRMADAGIRHDALENQHRVVISNSDFPPKERPQTKKRLASLDIFRGLTVALMILVDDAGGEWPMIGHAPWNGCNLADFVMPFFLFIVGVAIAFALKRIPDRLMAIKKVVLRTLKLLFWGLLLQGSFTQDPDKLTYGVDMKKIRWCGILQRIALAYLVVALLEIYTKKALEKDLSCGQFSIFKLYCWHWLMGACILIVYMAVSYGTYVPDWHFTVHDSDSTDYGKVLTVACGVRAKLDPPCNVVGYIDRKILGINHLYHRPAWRRYKACNEYSPYDGPFRKDASSWCFAPFEPEGILRNNLINAPIQKIIQIANDSSISSILSTLIGVHFGHILMHLKGHSERLKHWAVMGFALLVVGLTLHFTDSIPLNKQLYTFSYVCVTSGAAALVFSFFYTLVDIWEMRLPFLPLEWIGMNAMLVYVMAAEGVFAKFINGWYYGDPHNTLINWIQKHIFIQVWHSRKVGILLYVIFGEILFWAIVAGILHWMGLHWKL